MSGGVPERRERRPRRAAGTPAIHGSATLELCSPEAEMSLLGSLILDPSMIGDVAAVLRGEEDFGREAHAAIYRAIVAVHDRTGACDVVQLLDALRTSGVLAQTGGEEYLEVLAEAVPSAVNAPYYARIVADHARLRRLGAACESIVWSLRHDHDGIAGSADRLVDAAEASILAATERSSTVHLGLAELLELELRRACEPGEAGPTGLPTGFTHLDQLTGGMQPGEMIVVGARPSMGKTAFALALALRTAMPGDGSKPRAVAVFSLEMSRQAVARRLLSSVSGIPSTRFHAGAMSDRDVASLMAAAERIKVAPIHIDDSTASSPTQLRARARRFVRRDAVELVIVDYLQLMHGAAARPENRQVEVASISRSLKALARELNVPVVVCCQLNRQVEDRANNRPRMSDLRESGAIEQDADVVMLLHREAYYHRDDEAWKQANPDKIDLAEVLVEKQRNGPVGTARLRWMAPTTSFADSDPHALSAGRFPP